MFKPTLKSTPIILSLLLVTAAANSDAPPGTGKAGAAKSAVDRSDAISVSVTIGDARQLAREFGLTGHKPLPPGIRKNLAQGKPMPPGIAMTRMPEGFLTRLPHYEGYEWRISGTDLVLVAVGTLVIAHVLADVFE